jgi:hypothetical protein
VAVTRVPIDLGARFSFRRRRIELDQVLGLALSPMRVAGVGLTPNLAETRLDPEAHLALGLRWWLGARVGLETHVDLDVSFRTLDLLVGPMGPNAPVTVVGETPRVWIGFGLGVVVRVRNPERDSPQPPMM